MPACLAGVIPNLPAAGVVVPSLPVVLPVIPSPEPAVVVRIPGMVMAPIPQGLPNDPAWPPAL
jgi:hypothetical protein